MAFGTTFDNTAVDFLESLNVDYTTGGQPVFFANGSEPVTTNLQLSFKETQLITKESIRQGF